MSLFRRRDAKRAEKRRHENRMRHFYACQRAMDQMHAAERANDIERCRQILKRVKRIRHLQLLERAKW